jgi:hypothetical protein
MVRLACHLRLALAGLNLALSVAMAVRVWCGGRNVRVSCLP